MPTSPGHYDRWPKDYWWEDKQSHKEVPIVSILSPEKWLPSLHVDFVDINKTQCVHRSISHVVLNWEPVTVVTISSFKHKPDFEVFCFQVWNYWWPIVNKPCENVEACRLYEYSCILLSSFLVYLCIAADFIPLWWISFIPLIYLLFPPIVKGIPLT